MNNLKHLSTKEDFVEWYVSNQYHELFNLDYLSDIPIFLLWGIIYEWFTKHDIIPYFDQYGYGILIYNKSTDSYDEEWHKEKLVFNEETLPSIMNAMLGMALDRLYIVRDINEDKEEEF